MKWKIIIRERKKKKKINKGIIREEWELYFRRLLGGIEGKVVRGKKRGKEEEVNERELSGKEIKEAMGKLKDGKAAGVNEIPEEM